MLATIIVASVFAWFFTVASQRHEARRETRACERAAAEVLDQELSATIEVIDAALRDNDYRSLALISESRGLAEAWHQHSGAVWRAGIEPWQLMNEAVGAGNPRYGFEVRPSTAEQRELLRTRRQQLATAVTTLRTVSR
jgi:hypothetical protein